jgi:hypothetical protein
MRAYEAGCAENGEAFVEVCGADDDDEVVELVPFAGGVV